MKGKMELSCKEKNSFLAENGIRLVNAREKHRFILEEGTLAAVFYINSSYISYLAARPSVEFQLDSSRPPEYGYEQLRSLLRRILSIHTWQRWQEKLKEQQYFCQLLSILLKNYAVWDFTEKEIPTEQEDRTGRIVEFIHTYYNRQIGLGDLAEQLHLSVPYLSKYIKKNLHSGFVEYLNAVRLSHTVDDLLFTEHSVTRVAFDNGFSNLASFNRVFKEVFSVTPSEYRKKNKRRELPKEKKCENKNVTLLRDYLSESPEGITETGFENRIFCRADVSVRKKYIRIWDQLWNLGSAEELLRADIQRHILFLKKELGIQNVHIWGFFSEEMLIRLGRTGNYNFSRIDQVLDFLVSEHLVPLIDLGFHPKELYGAGETIFYREKEKGYEDPDLYQELIREFVLHCVQRYGVEETGRWGFEISKDDRLFLHGGEKFFRLYRAVSRMIKENIPNAKIGGGAIFIYDDLSILKEFLEGWKKRGEIPDFVSVWVYPYELLSDGEKTKKLYVSGNPDYICEKIDLAQRTVREYGDIPLYVTRWDLSLSCRNYLNESCYRAAYLIKNTVSCLENTQVMSCFGSTDLSCDFFDSVGSLFGGYGLITRDGIRKPAFYAYRFLQSMGEFYIAGGENYLITCGGRNNYYVLLFHCCRMDTMFYRDQKEDIGAGELDRLFEEETVNIHITLEHVPDGKYLIKQSRLRAGEGSILDEWKKLGYKKNLDREEIQYLASICIPRLEYTESNAEKGELVINAALETNEIRLYQIRFVE